MSLFSTSKTNTQSFQYLTDASANAGTNSVALSGGSQYIGEGSIVTDNGSSVTINTLSDAVALAAMNSTGMTADNAMFYMGQTADNAMNYNAATSVYAMDAARDMAKMVMAENQSARTAASEDAKNNASFAASMANMVADSKKDPNNLTIETLGKYAVWGVGILAALVAAVLALRGSKNTTKKTTS